MAIFNSYVKLPEGIWYNIFWSKMIHFYKKNRPEKMKRWTSKIPYGHLLIFKVQVLSQRLNPLRGLKHVPIFVGFKSTFLKDYPSLQQTNITMETSNSMFFPLKFPFVQIFHSFVRLLTDIPLHLMDIP